MSDREVWRWSADALLAAYREGELDPVEVTDVFLERIGWLDERLHAFVTVTEELARSQATAARQRIRQGDPAPLLGVPVSIKDVFHVAGVVTTLGSLVHRESVSPRDSGAVRRLRQAGAVFVGKTNTAEFGQSATTENLLGPATRNPWDPERTPGGSSGGAATSVAARMAVMAVGSDGGGSIRIPAALTGLFGFKPSLHLCPDEDGFRAMTDFVTPGPISMTVSDARRLLGVMADSEFVRSAPGTLRIGFCERPEGRPVDGGVAAAVREVARLLEELGHRVEQVDLDLSGWNEAFAPLVLHDEGRERGHLLSHPELLTEYERTSLLRAVQLDGDDVESARAALTFYRARIDGLLSTFDLLLTPTTAVPAFPLGTRPRTIDGQPVDKLWGPFPFAVPFNVAGVPAASIPCGLLDSLPVGAQLVTRSRNEGTLLDVCEDLEEALGFDHSLLFSRLGGKQSVGSEGSSAAGEGV